ncbi:MAG: hypothetical protein FRX48_05490 [Lasallia pustulata]|uniref:Uncharacterized protein n=1 Tax=Lasallia pustulata TaxID=136370 RepID=A0A5M8PR81_9LECA|nr:MAG: hypothetical protein FRX48_05490 [Lasallia pustulata]
MLPSDSLLHQSHKILADITSVPPPPYSKPHNPPTDDEDDEGNDDGTVSSQPPITITVDTSTRIVGHANDIHLPHSPSPPGQIACMLLAALKSAQQDGGKRGLEIKLQTGFSICGSRNVVVLGPMGAQGLAKEKRPQGEPQSSVDGGQNTASRKRRAESEPAEMPNAKKAVARDLEPRG